MRKVKSVYKYIIGLLVLVVFLQCEGNDKENDIEIQVNNTTTQKITANDISQIKYTEYALSDLAEKSTDDWLKFKLLSTQIINLKNGNLSFFVDDKTILESFVDGLISEIPELLNESSILVRISVIKTALYKLDESYAFSSPDKQPIIDNIKDLLLAYNHLLLQINKRVEKESRTIAKPK